MLCICVKSSSKGHSNIRQQGQLWEERAEKGGGWTELGVEADEILKHLR